MKSRNLALILALAVTPAIALAQRTAHSEEKPTSATTRSESSATERQRSAVRSKAQAGKFSQVAVALNLNRQQRRAWQISLKAHAIN